MDRKKLIKVMMEQGRKVSADIDAQLEGHGKIQGEIFHLVRELEHTNQLIEIQFNKMLNEGNSNLRVLMDGKELAEDLRTYFEDVGLMLAEPKMRRGTRRGQRSEEEQDLAQFIGHMLGL